MKTLGELRALIAQNSGELRIGHLLLKRGSEGDIDVHLEDDLITWFKEDLADDTILAGIGTINSSLAERREAKYELDRLKKEVRGFEECPKMLEKLRGIVEAYEKLLIGRQVTIGK